MHKYLFNLLIALDNTLNALLNGNPCEVISARVYREKRYKLVAIIDWLFWWESEHCKQSYHWLKSRKNLPFEYYEK